MSKLSKLASTVELKRWALLVEVRKVKPEAEGH
jgi:hypothetical protein